MIASRSAASAGGVAEVGVEDALQARQHEREHQEACSRRRGRPRGIEPLAEGARSRGVGEEGGRCRASRRSSSRAASPRGWACEGHPASASWKKSRTMLGWVDQRRRSSGA